MSAGRPPDFGLLEDKVRDAIRGRSDDAPFAFANVPTLFFSTSLQTDYHQRTDTVEKIDIDTLLKIARAVLLTIEALDR